MLDLVISSSAESVATSFKDATVRGEDFKLPLFDIDTIATATDNFSMQNKLGEGGFGPVYKVTWSYYKSC